MTNNTPRVLALIATPILGGPGKGLLQFARHASTRTRMLVCNFSYRGRRSELYHRAIEQRVPIELLTQRYRLDPTPLIRTLQLVNERGINVLQSHGYKGHLVAWYVARRTGLPWVAFAHGWTDEDWKARLYNRIDRWLLRRATLAVAVSRPLHQELKAWRGPHRPTALLLNAVDPAELKRELGGPALRKQLGFAAGHTVIGCFGRLSREKGHAHLLHALAALRDEGDRFRLVVVGQGPEQASLQALAQRLGLAERIRFEGYRENMGDYFDAVDLVALPSLSEGTPNVVLEALALSRPVLASCVGGVGDLVFHGVNGWLVQPGDSAGIASVLREIAQRPASVAELGAHGPGTLDPCFAPGARAARLEALYENLLHGTSANVALEDGKDPQRKDAEKNTCGRT